MSAKKTIRYDLAGSPGVGRRVDIDPIDTDLFWFSEWLDSGGLMRGDDETDDDRSHEQLVRDFLAADAKGEAGRAVPRGERCVRHDLPAQAVGRRLFVDAEGFAWWDNQDGMASMVSTNPDNTPIPQPWTYYVPDVRS